MFRFSKIIIFIAFFANLSAKTAKSSENQNMEFIAHKQVGYGKEKVLVMHNWMGDSTSYDSMLPYLNTDEYTYVFVDLRGYGRSKQMPGTYSVEEASADAIKLIDSLAWNKFHLIGHSMSGMIVQKIAVDNPARVKSVVAITPVPACGSAGPQEMFDFFESAALSNDDAAMQCINTLTSNCYTKKFAKKMVTDWRQRSTSEARLGYLNMFFYTDFSELVKGLQIPILVLIGEHDFEGSEAFMRNTFMNWYPNAQLEWCKASGHYPMIETPIALVATIEKFLSTNKVDSRDFGNVQIKQSKIGQFKDGLGVFANREFAKGDVVIQWNLKILKQQDFENLPKYEQENFCHRRNGNIYYYPDPERHVNRSKKPNVVPDFVRGANIALCDIRKGEELSISDTTKEDF